MSVKLYVSITYIKVSFVSLVYCEWTLRKRWYIRQPTWGHSSLSGVNIHRYYERVQTQRRERLCSP